MWRKWTGISSFFPLQAMFRERLPLKLLSRAGETGESSLSRAISRAVFHLRRRSVSGSRMTDHAFYTGATSSSSAEMTVPW